MIVLLQKEVGNWDGKKNINHPQKIKSNTFKIKYYLYTPFALLRFYAFTAAATFVLFLFYIDTHDFIIYILYIIYIAHYYVTIILWLI